jgi:hypothetical protein
MMLAVVPQQGSRRHPRVRSRQVQQRMCLFLSRTRCNSDRRICWSWGLVLLWTLTTALSYDESHRQFIVTGLSPRASANPQEKLATVAVEASGVASFLARCSNSE